MLPRPSPLPPERYLSIFRRRRRIFSAIISRRRFQVNANLQVTRVSFVCARLYVRVPASSLSLSLCVRRLKRKPHSSRLGKRKTMMKSWWRGCLNASNWIASFIRRDNADGSSTWAQGARLFHYFREKKPHLATCRCILDASSKSSAIPFNHASRRWMPEPILYSIVETFNNPLSYSIAFRIRVCAREEIVESIDRMKSIVERFFHGITCEAKYESYVF